ncbi:MAG: hypothetical protein BGP09_27615, partial [Rhizobium sp. 60-20]
MLGWEALDVKFYQAANEGGIEFPVSSGEATKGENLIAGDSDRPLPEAGGFLQWDRSAAHLSTLVSALQSPHHGGPRVSAKIRLPGRAVRVGRLEVLPTRSGCAAGTLLEIGAYYWRVATGSTDVVVADLSELTGKLQAAGDLARELQLYPNEVLPTLSREDVQVLDEAYQTAAAYEDFWLRALEGYCPLSISGHASGEPLWRGSPWQRIDALAKLDPALRVESILAAWAVYLARTNSEMTIQFGWKAQVPRSPLLEGLLASVVPMEVEIDADQSFAEVRSEIAEACKRAVSAGSYVRDLLMQVPQLRRIAELRRAFPWDFGIAIIGDDSRPKSEIADQGVVGGVLTLQIRASDGALRWIYDQTKLSDEQTERMSRHLVVLAEEALSQGVSVGPVGRLNLLPSDERLQLVEGWNATVHDYGS